MAVREEKRSKALEARRRALALRVTLADKAALDDYVSDVTSLGC